MKLKVSKQAPLPETKQRIYDAAVKILKEQDFAHFTVSNVCKQANVSNGSFFYHFKTKDELLTYYTYDNFAEFRRRHGFNAAVKDLGYGEKLITFYCYWADYMEKMGLAFFSDFYHTKNYALDVRRWNQREPVSIWNYPGECLTAAKAEGIIKDEVTVDHAAEVLGSLAKGVAFDWCLSEGAFNMRERIREVMKPYLESIRA